MLALHLLSKAVCVIVNSTAMKPSMQYPRSKDAFAWPTAALNAAWPEPLVGPGTQDPGPHAHNFSCAHAPMIKILEADILSYIPVIGRRI